MDINNAIAAPQAKLATQHVTAPDTSGSARLTTNVDKLALKQAAAGADKSTAQDTRISVQEAVDKVEKFVSLTNSEIKFTVDDETGMSIVKVVDKATDQVIRQIPSEEMVAIAKTLDKLQGLLFKDKA